MTVPLLAGACGGDPSITPAPSDVTASAAPGPTPSFPERPYADAAWPAAGTACGIAGYNGLLGRIEATAPRTVRFTLCEPDGAFPARLAHPALGVIDAAAVDAIAADPGAARTVAGAGTFRVGTWSAGGDIQLERVAKAADGATASASPATPPSGDASGSPAVSGAPVAAPPVIVLRWATSSSDRAAALGEAEVDGIDAPSASDASAMGALPELAVMDRPGLATAYLGFGSGKTFAKTAVRRAFAQALDHQALAREAFPAGSTPATHLSPCSVPAGCAGKAWDDFNGPAAVAALEAAGFDTGAPVTLHVPDAPVAGIPDPASLGAAIAAQLKASVGVTVTVEAATPVDLAAAVAEERLEGLYLGGVTSILADPSGFLEPLFGADASGVAVVRAKDVPEALADAADATGPASRAAAFARANDAIRASAPVVPLAHAGSTAAYRADVAGVAISPIGVDPLGDFRPADRRQLVVMAPAEPAGAWCGVAVGTPEALRLCALVTPGLYAFRGAGLTPAPALASRCTPSAAATVWTCRLREDLVTTDGRTVDAGDVLASFRAQADAGSALRAASPASAFGAWDALFRGPVPAGTR
ncbi:MAG TPA: ABC transporter substrate-binding protein [Candidatus Limnocylindrales bacterium]|nr:ABC transporter substrate-binding protein [Candidatus Limnocylindrales bacterium]